MRSLRSKLVLTFGACMMLILGIVVTYTAYKLREQAIESAHTHILQTVRNTAWHTKAVIDQGVIYSRMEKQMFARPVSVLLAEDDDINRIFVEELLRSRNCTVVSVV